MTAYYNEFDKHAAQWLRELIAEGHIAPGDVDERDIQDVLPSDLAGYTQCHFFAGIGVWSYALRQAGWADDRPVWTGSCPCQPFSAAGKGAAFDDERHLWPAFHHLIGQRRPPVVFGEQVASKDGLAWLDLVHADLEGTGYAFGAVDLCSAGVGAPHIRQRLYWVADADEHLGNQGRADVRGRSNRGNAQPRTGFGGGELSGRLGDAHHQGLEGLGGRHQAEGRRIGALRSTPAPGESGGLVHANSRGRRQGRVLGPMAQILERRADQRVEIAESGLREQRPGPTNGFWRAADWLGCRDGKWRPVSAKPQPLVDGSAESLGRVRAEVIAKIEEEINAQSMESEIRRASVLRDLQEALGAQSNACWTAGRIPRLHEAPFLLAFLRQLTAQGWSLAKDSPLPRSQAAGGELRMLRDDEQSTSAPRRYGLDEQRSGEYSDAVHFLSSLLARHALTEWDNAYAAYAELGFPLAHNARSRVVRLRGYGNAVNAEAAKAFVSSYLECRV